VFRNLGSEQLHRQAKAADSPRAGGVIKDNRPLPLVTRRPSSQAWPWPGPSAGTASRGGTWLTRIIS